MFTLESRLKRLLCPIMVVLCVTCSLANADEKDELRHRAEAMELALDTFKNQGNKDAAHHVARVLEKLIEEIEHGGDHEAHSHEHDDDDAEETEYHELQKIRKKLGIELKKMQAAGAVDEQLRDIRHEIESVTRELHEIEGDRREEHRERESDRVREHRERIVRVHERRTEGEAQRRQRNPEQHERLEHLHAAVHHLHEAGLHDVAEQVARRAESGEREGHDPLARRPGPRDPHARGEGDPIHEVMRQLNEMRQHMERLTKEVQELKQH